MNLRDLCAELGDWLDGSGPHADVVLSSRVRLARNVEGAPFPHRADDRQRARVFREITEACRDLPGLDAPTVWDLEEVPACDRVILVERHLASPDLVSGSGARGVVVGAGECAGVMINEEDHVRIQSVTSGLNLMECLDRARRMDSGLEKRIPFACRDDLGYLTTCPSNVGTGLRASVLIHLPALVLAGEARKVHRAVGEMGMAVRGWFGEGSAALGDFYQLSNQRTLGREQAETVEELVRVTERVLALETEAREKIRAAPDRNARIEDRIFRAYGTLRHARLLSVEQLMSCASDLRLGRWFGLLESVPQDLLDRLALFGQPGHLGKRCGKVLKDDEEGWARAEWVRSELASLQE